jgi:AbrB family looped-hinge helix DNA binding protein
MQATLSSKFQITIPARLRKKFRLKPGMKLDFDENAPDLRARPRYDFDVQKMYSVIGSAKDFMPGKSGKEVLIALRGYDRNEL